PSSPPVLLLGTAVDVDVFRPHLVVLLDRNIERPGAIDAYDPLATGAGAAVHATHRTPRLIVDGDLIDACLHRLDVRKVVGGPPPGIVVRVLVVPGTQRIGPLDGPARQRRAGGIVDKPRVDLLVVLLSDLEVVRLGVPRYEPVEVARAQPAIDHVESVADAESSAAQQEIVQPHHPRLVLAA